MAGIGDTVLKKESSSSPVSFFLLEGIFLFFFVFLMMIECDDKIIVPIWFYNVYDKNIIFLSNVYNLLHN